MRKLNEMEWSLGRENERRAQSGTKIRSDSDTDTDTFVSETEPRQVPKVEHEREPGREAHLKCTAEGKKWRK